jgi:sugar (pentulose or hexulose) kinase
LRPAILWIDQRLADVERWPPGWMHLPLRLLGLYRPVIDLIRNCEANWIRQNQPEIWQQTHKLLLLSGYLHFKLTGSYTDSVGNNVGYLPFDRKTFRWAGGWDIAWKMFPIEPEKLPDLVDPTEPIGQVTEQAAKETGLPRGLPVIAAASDKACEILGSGCLTPETGCLSYGTLATVSTATAQHIKLGPLLPPFPGAVPGEYYTEVSIMRGYWLVRWFKEEFGLQEKLIAEERNVAPEMLFDEMIRTVPPGSMGLVLQPYWTPGIFTDYEAKGTITGFGEVHTRAHLYRAILEGLTYGLKEGAMLIERKSGVAMESLRVSGGGSQSPTAMQITADVFGLPAVRPHTYETSTLGAAIVAAVGLKIYGSFRDALKAMTRPRDQIEPIPENNQIYQELFQRVYRKLYPRMRPLLKEIQEITGYPEDTSRRASGEL